ncbi:hepatic lectin-like isoform X4 [Pelodiscus sinensis]|uniref:hepatic lectin-like isoform X4 n=1 Tax=Pelodiscus sinensis TaxID=13735 RepID=UPI003F6C4642
MDMERLQDELRMFKDRHFPQQRLRSSLTVYVLLALSYLLIIILFVVSLSRVSVLSSQLSEQRSELKQNHSSNEFKPGYGNLTWLLPRLSVSVLSSQLSELRSELKQNHSSNEFKLSVLSSQLSEQRSELKQNHSSNEFKLFPCGPEAREWEYFSGKCYYFSLRVTSWQTAKALCEEKHAQLAIINSHAKQNFIMYRTRDKRFWIGLSDQNAEGEWKWIDGSDSTAGFTYWKEGEPSDSNHNEDCAHVWTYGEWNDVHCTYECYYICEKPVPL